MSVRAPTHPELATTAAQGNVLALSDALEALIAAGQDTPTDRAYAFEVARKDDTDTAAAAFARAAITGRVVQSKGLRAAHLVADVERNARRSREIDPNFRDGAATRLLGASALRALVVDVLPNVAGPVLVLATLDLGNAVLLLAGLSFLGLGAQPGPPEWGSMVNVGTQYFEFWWMGTFPGFAILSVVLAFNFLGDSLRDALDPRSSWAVKEGKP